MPCLDQFSFTCNHDHSLAIHSHAFSPLGSSQALDFQPKGMVLPDGHQVGSEPTLVIPMSAKVFSLLAPENPLSCQGIVLVRDSVSVLTLVSFQSHFSNPIYSESPLISIPFLPSHVVTSEDVTCLQAVGQKTEEISRLEEMNLYLQVSREM